MIFCRHALLTLLAAAVIVTAPGRALSDDEAPASAVAETIEHAVVISVKGRLAALARDAVAIHPGAYRGEWVITSAIDAGARVRKGDTLVRFDGAELALAIDRARFDRSQALLTHRHRLEEIRQAEEAVRDEFRRTERSLIEARLRLKGWLGHQLAMARQDAELNEESWKINIDNLREELKELEKMYAEDELVEATEELVLRRTRRSLAHRLATYEQVLRKRKFHVEFDESLRAEKLKLDLDLQDRAYSRRRVAAATQDRNRRAALERASHGLLDLDRKIAKLLADRRAMKVRAPRDGILIHGTDVTDDHRLRPGQRVTPRQTFLTVVDPSILTVKAQVPVRRRLRIAVGQTLEIAPEVDGAGALRSEIRRIGLFASKDQTVTILGEVRLDRPHPGAPGGVTCAVRIHAGTERVVVVPIAAIVRKDGKASCRVKAADGSHETREVETGEEVDGRVIVRKGLKDGEEVLLPGDSR